MLTAIACTQAKPERATKEFPSPKPYKLFDSGGLFLLVNPNGSKLWRLKYRFGGCEKLLALGSFELVPLAKARDKRDAAKKHLLDSIDPATVKEDAKAAGAALPWSSAHKGEQHGPHATPGSGYYFHAITVWA